MAGGGNFGGAGRHFSVSRRDFLRPSLPGEPLLAACQRSARLLTSSSAGASAPKRGGDLNLREDRGPQTIDPSAAIDTESIWTVLCLYDCLYDVTARRTLGDSVAGYRLRAVVRPAHLDLSPPSGVKFSDGRPLDSTDVKFTSGAGAERPERLHPFCGQRHRHAERRPRSSSTPRTRGGRCRATCRCTRTPSCRTSCEA